MNYDTMPAGPEMDRLIVEKVMRANLCWEDSLGSYWQGGEGRGYYIGNLDDPWFPSRNIVHAMEAVAAMRKHKNNWFVLNWYGDSETWHAGQGDGTMDWPGEAETAPLAICRALLKAATL